jgi:tetratricopeptide (TPR) repeat protein
MSVRALRKLESGATQTPRRDTIDLLASALDLDETAQVAFAHAARRSWIAGSNAAAQPQRPTRGEESPLIGREAELTLVARHLAGATPPLLALTGEPGIGKSRLLAEAAISARTQGWRVIVGGCTRRSGQAPYEPLVSALAREVRQTPPARLRLDLQGCGWLVRLLPELLETRLVPAPSWTLPAEQERRLMFGAVARYLANVAGPAGTLLLLDDLQWAGGDALALVEALVKEAAEAAWSAPLRLIGAYRGTEVRADDQLGLLLADLAREGQAMRHQLPLLTAEEAQILLAQLWPPGRETAGQSTASEEALCEETLREETLRRAEGLPFYLISSARAALDRQTMRKDVPLTTTIGSGHALEVPASVAESVQTRVAALPQEARQLVGVAAVAGRIVSGALLLALATRPEAETLDALEALVHAGLLAEDGVETYGFTHDLVREAVEAALGSQRRRTLHRRIAEELERGDDDEARRSRSAEIATHFVAAGEQRRALPYALLAGDQAKAVYAHSEAERHFRSAVELARHLQDQHHEAEAHEKLGAIFTIQGRQHDAMEALERAASLYRDTGDGEGHLRVSAQLADLCGVMWRADDGLKRFAPLAAAADNSGAYTASPGLARLYYALSGLYTQKAAPAGRNHTMIRAEELARAAHDDVILARVLTQRGRQGFYVGDDAGAPDLRDVLSLAERLGDPQVYLEVLGSLAGIQYHSGDLASAQVCHQRGLALAEQVQDYAAKAGCLVGLGTVDLCRGEWRQARVLFEQAETIYERLVRAGVPETFVTIPLSLATLDIWQGRGEQAVARLEETLALIQLRGVRPSEGPAISALSECDLVEGRIGPARQRLSEFCTRPTVHGWERGWEYLWLQGLPWLAWAQLASGDCEESARTIQTAVARARARSYPLILVDALRIQAMVAAQQEQYHAATGDLDEAITLCQAIPYPYAEAKALWVYGQLEAARGHPVAATDQFAAALAICDRLGEGLYRTYIERDLRPLAQKG